MQHIRIALDETTYGDPLGRQVPVLVSAYADDSLTPFFSHLRTDGFVHNYISFVGEGEGSGGDGVVRHLVDNLKTSFQPVPVPILSIAPYGTNAILTWPAFAPNYREYAATNLTPPATWTPIGTVLLNASTEFRLAVPLDAQFRLYRLGQ